MRKRRCVSSISSYSRASKLTSTSAHNKPRSIRQRIYELSRPLAEAKTFEDAKLKHELSRPISEVPTFDYEKFVEDNEPSELRYRILFPEQRDIGKRTDYRDLRTERDLLAMAIDWNDELVGHIYQNVKGTNNLDRVQFLRGLREELQYDWQEVVEEKNELKIFIEPLAMWEFRNLDNDGKTEGIERRIRKGENVFWGTGGREARVKYGCFTGG